MACPVFLSYARKSSREYALKLHETIDGDGELAFLDTSDIKAGERFPAVLVDAILGARVVVVFAEKVNFVRDYNLLELEAALHPFTLFLKRHEITEKQKTGAFTYIVIALPPPIS